MKKKKIMQTLAITLVITSVSALSPMTSKQGGLFTQQEASAEVTKVQQVIQDNIVYWIMSDNTVKIMDGHNYKGDLVVPSTINGFPVTSVNAYAFANSTKDENYLTDWGRTPSDNTFLTSIKLPDSVTTMENHVFYNCKSLKTFEGNGITNMGSYNFIYCTALTEVLLPKVPALQNYDSFNYDDYNIQIVSMSSAALTGLTTFSYTKSNLTGYFKVYLMDSDEATPLGAFLVKQGTNLSGLAPVPVQYGNTFNKWIKASTASTSVIGNIQDNCTFIASYTAGTLSLPAPTVTMSSATAVNRDSTVTAKITGLQAGLNYVYTLDGSTPTTANGFILAGDTINIPKQDTDQQKTITVNVAATTKGVYSPVATGSVTFLAGIVSNDPTTVHDGVTYSLHSNGTATIQGVSSSLTGNITIPDTINGNKITEIGQAAFKNCTGITGIALPDSITSIGAFAFQGCTGLTDIILPNSVTSLNGGTFSGCTNLASIKLSENIMSIKATDFDNCDSLNFIKAPASVVNKTTLTNYNKVRFIDEDEATYVGGWYVRSGYSMAGKQSAPPKADKTFSKWTRYTPVSVSTLGDIEDNVVFESVYLSTPGTTVPKVATTILTPSKSNPLNRETGITIKIS